MGTIHNATEDLLNEHDVARITGMSVASVRRWRLLRLGPKFLKLNSAVRYRAMDLEAWLESRPTGGEESLRPTMSNVAHRSRPEVR
jgi:predicted DNA-binding transcriptional regulator AlpA